MTTSLVRIFSASAVKSLVSAGLDLNVFTDRFSSSDSTVGYYPDGSLRLKMTEGGEEALAYLKTFVGPSNRIEGAVVTRSLISFSADLRYCIQYPATYQNELKTDMGFAVRPAILALPSAGETLLTNLDVLVCFRTRITPDIQLQFCESLLDWSRKASISGAFGEGPAKLATSEVTFHTSISQFKINAGESGQETLNWLALAILDFGENIHPVAEIFFGPTAEVLKYFITKHRGRKSVVPLQPAWVGNRQPTSKTPGTFNSTISNFDVTPSKTFTSDKFNIFEHSFYNEWDSFRFTIHFTLSLGNERKLLFSLLDAWLLIGSFGGLGGRGIRHADKINMNKSANVVSVSANMGDCDQVSSIRMLIRLLEEFQQSGLSIDFLIMGHPEPIP